MSKNKTKEEKKAHRLPLKAFYSIFLLFLLVLSILNIIVYFNKKPKAVYGNEPKQVSKLDLWQSLLSAHPEYFEGWIEITSIYLEDGDFISAKESFFNAKRINPNSPKIKEISKYLEKNNL